MRIQKVHARQILDSRGNPTVEVDLITNHSVGTASVPSGASTGKHEAIELRDGGVAYGGKGVSKAVHNVNKVISESLAGQTVDEQSELDSKLISLDGTKDKSKLGANALLGVSMAATKAGSIAHKLHLFEYLSALYDHKDYTLPIPFANIINGGEHAGNDLQFQEFMIAPIYAKSFTEAVKIITEIYAELKLQIGKNYGSASTAVGDEGGFAPGITTPEEALKLIENAAWGLGYSKKIGIAMDAAANEFYNAEEGKYEVIKGQFMSGEELIDYYEKLVSEHNIVSIEDPFEEDDYKSFQELNKRIGHKVQIVADDLTVTNPERIKRMASLEAANSLLLKVNQIGTVTEAMQASHEAESAGWSVMVSHRSGETEDSFISDLAVGIGASMIKLGAPARGERTAKYNQLLRIEDYLGSNAKYAKWHK